MSRDAAIFGPQRNKRRTVYSVAYSLIEASDSCRIQEVATSGTIAVTETADAAALTGYNLARGSLLLTDSKDTAALVGSAGGTAGTSDADFVSRRSTTGVIRWHKFNNVTDVNSSVQLATVDSAPITGYDALGPHDDNYQAKKSYYWATGSLANPTIDTAVYPSGSGSLRMDIPQGNSLPGHLDAVSGAFYYNFANDFSQKFRAGSPPLYIQFRLRVDDNYMNTIFVDSTNHRTSPKISITTDGDTSTTFGPSCSAVQVVFNDYNSNKVPAAYDSCTGSASHTSPYAGLYSHDSAGYHIQDNMPSCTSSNVQGCWTYKANQWMTFQVMIDLSGATYNATNREWDNSKVKIWAAYEGQPSTLVLDWNPTTPGYFPLTASYSGEDANGVPVASGGGQEQNLGKIELTNFITNFNTAQTFPTCHVWYDELIISTAQLPDPQSITGLAGMQPNTLRRLADFTSPAIAPSFGDTQPLIHVTDQAMMAYDAKRRVMLQIGGGHAGSNNDAMHRFDLTSLTWSTDYTPTPQQDWLQSNYDFTRGAWLASPSGLSDGPYPRPSMRHTEQCNVVVGDEFIMMKFVEGNGIDVAGTWTTNADYTLVTRCGAQIAHYNIDSHLWSWPGAVTCFPGDPNTGNTGGWPAALYDEVSGLILVVTRDSMFTYDPVNHVRTRIKGVGIVAMDTCMPMAHYPPKDTATTRTYYWLNCSGAYAGRVWEIVFNRTTPTATTIAEVTTTGTFVTQVKSSNPSTGDPTSGEKSADYDPITQWIISGPIVNSGVVYFNLFDANTYTWTSVTPDAPADGVWPSYLLTHNGRIDPVTGAWVFVDYGAKTWAYKLPAKP